MGFLSYLNTHLLVLIESEMFQPKKKSSRAFKFRSNGCSRFTIRDCLLRGGEQSLFYTLLKFDEGVIFSSPYSTTLVLCSIVNSLNCSPSAPLEHSRRTIKCSHANFKRQSLHSIDESKSDHNNNL